MTGYSREYVIGRNCRFLQGCARAARLGGSGLVPESLCALRGGGADPSRTSAVGTVTRELRFLVRKEKKIKSLETVRAAHMTGLGKWLDWGGRDCTGQGRADTRSLLECRVYVVARKDGAYSGGPTSRAWATSQRPELDRRARSTFKLSDRHAGRGRTTRSSLGWA